MYVEIAAVDGAVVHAHQAANIQITVDAARSVAAVDGAVVVVVSHQATDFGGTVDAARGVAVRDLAVVKPNQAANIHAPVSVDTARCVTAANGAVVPADQTAHRKTFVASADCAQGIAGEDGAAVEAHQAAYMRVTADIALGVAAANGAVVRAHQAADVAVSTDHAFGMAAADGAVVPAHQAADVGAAGNTLPRQPYIFNDTLRTYTAKKSQIVRGRLVQVRWNAVDGQPGDGMAQPVKRSCEYCRGINVVRVICNGRKATAVVPARRAIGGNVRAEHVVAAQAGAVAQALQAVGGVFAVLVALVTQVGDDGVVL